MDAPEDLLTKIQALVDRNSKYKFEAYSFILSALHYTMTNVKPPRHVSGQEFCDGIRRYAIEQYGPMARTVLEHWGATSTMDFGQIVFDLVDIGLMRKTEEDSLNDFKDVYDFRTAFSSKNAFELQ